MTQTEAYDLACKRWKDPAAVQMGPRCILGEWLPLAELILPEGASPVILPSASRAVRVYGIGATWDEAVAHAGLMSESLATPSRPSVITSTRMATIRDVNVLAHKDDTLAPITAVSNKGVCRTYGCGAPRTEGPFCPKCFEEHRDEREVTNPAPPATRRGS